MDVKINMKPIEDVLKDLGITPDGELQEQLTKYTLRAMQRYMPWKTGRTARVLTKKTAPDEITVDAPYARYLYYGVGKSGKPLNYTRTHNKLAGPYWDRTMMDYEAELIVKRALLRRDDI